MISHVTPSRPRRAATRGEEDDAGEEDVLAPGEVAGSAAEQEEAAEDQGVGVDDPLQARVRHVEVRLDRRQCDVDDRRVEDDHELRQADEDEDEPRVDTGGHRSNLAACPGSAAGRTVAAVHSADAGRCAANIMLSLCT